MQYLSFWVWLISLSITSSSSSVLLQDFLFKGWIIFHRVYIVHFLCSFISDRHLGCFHVLAVVNNTTVSMIVQISLWDPDLSSFKYIPMRRMLDHVVVLISEEPLLYCCHSDCTRSHQPNCLANCLSFVMNSHQTFNHSHFVFCHPQTSVFFNLIIPCKHLQIAIERNALSSTKRDCLWDQRKGLCQVLWGVSFSWHC